MPGKVKRPSTGLPAATIERAAALQVAGLSGREIARRLAVEGRPASRSAIAEALKKRSGAPGAEAPEPPAPGAGDPLRGVAEAAGRLAGTALGQLAAKVEGGRATAQDALAIAGVAARAAAAARTLARGRPAPVLPAGPPEEGPRLTPAERDALLALAEADRADGNAEAAAETERTIAEDDARARSPEGSPT